MRTNLPPDGTELVEITFTLPVLDTIAKNVKAEALFKAKEAYVMVLLSAGEITSGKAASVLGTSRMEMIDRMNQLGISLFDNDMDMESLSAEVAQASTAKQRASMPSPA